MGDLLELTEREREVVRCRSLGWSVKRIAHELGISISTVKTHLARIFTKLEVQTTVDMLRRTHVADECPACRAFHARGHTARGPKAQTSSSPRILKASEFAA